MESSFSADNAFAQGGGNSPWENAVNVLQAAFTGPIAKGLALVAIVVGGLTFAFGEGGGKENLRWHCLRFRDGRPGRQLPHLAVRGLSTSEAAHRCRTNPVFQVIESPAHDPGSRAKAVLLRARIGRVRIQSVE